MVANLAADPAIRAKRIDAAIRPHDAALRLVQINYQAGLVNYLQVLIPNSQYLQAKLSYIGTVGQRFQGEIRLWEGKGRDRKLPLAFDLEALPGGDEHRYRGSVLQEPTHQARALDQVLEVVQHQQAGRARQMRRGR